MQVLPRGNTIKARMEIDRLVRFLEGWPDGECGGIIKHGTIRWLEEQREVKGGED